MRDLLERELAELKARNTADAIQKKATQSAATNHLLLFGKNPPCDQIDYDQKLIAQVQRIKELEAQIAALPPRPGQ